MLFRYLKVLLLDYDIITFLDLDALDFIDFMDFSELKSKVFRFVLDFALKEDLVGLSK